MIKGCCRFRASFRFLFPFKYSVFPIALFTFFDPSEAIALCSACLFIFWSAGSNILDDTSDEEASFVASLSCQRFLGVPSTAKLAALVLAGVT
jgi:hypothetical protein